MLECRAGNPAFHSFIASVQRRFLRMNSKSTWIWLLLGAGLSVFIFFLETRLHRPVAGPTQIIPSFKAAAVTSIQVRPVGQLEIRIERTNDLWQLTKPVVYPAQTACVEKLLRALENLTPAAYITAHELRQRPRADEEFGFDSPQASLVIQDAEGRRQILIGNKTAPGDQVFLQVIGLEGVYVVDADLVKLIPNTANAWRTESLVDLNGLAFDRIIVSNAAKVIEFQLDPTNRLWRMTRPLFARADNDRITEALVKLHSLQVLQFVSDDPKADLESFGLQPPDLELALAIGTNTVALLQFGKNPTNAVGEIYACRQGINSVITVARELVEPWRAGVKYFRDPHMLAPGARPDVIEIRGEDNFVLRRLGSNDWSIVSEKFPVDADLVNDFVRSFVGLQIVQFVKDVVTAPDLPAYGLAAPKREVLFKSAVTNAAKPTNVILAQLSFGTTQEDKVFARRADEDFVYAVKLVNLERLPWASWQFRERQIWNFSENDVMRLTICQAGKTQQLLRNGTNSWAFAEGSQGLINDFAVEEIVHRFGELTATVWVSRGCENLAYYGFTTNSLSIAFDLKNGEKRAVGFGGISPAGYPYASVVLDGQTWVFEFPLALYQLVSSYLNVGNVP